MTKEMTEKKNKNKKINKMTKITMTITMQHLLSMLSLLVVQQCSLVVESFQPRNILPSSSVVTAGTTVPLSSSLLRLNAEPPSSKSSSSPNTTNEMQQQQLTTTTLFSDVAGGTPALPTTTTTESTMIEAKTMDERIYGFNKKLIDTVYDVICFLYPVTGTERDYARFYVLETVARVPYFAYLSVLHLRETFGERGMGERMRTHYAEADNELHHLLIMESLGGNSNIVDRTLAQSMAFGYYWYVILIYIWNEPAAYHLSELIENHAYDTYSKFVNEYGSLLKTKPVPAIARKYYEEDNPFLFDLFCTVKEKQPIIPNNTVDGGDDNNGGSVDRPVLFHERRPTLNSLYDVFVNIRDDEKEHWKTLCNLVQYDDMNAIDASQVRSTTPTSANAIATTSIPSTITENREQR